MSIKQDTEISQEVMEALMGEFECDPDIAECGAKCCSSILLLSDKEIAQIKNYIGRNHIKPINRHNVFSQDYIDVCPFLDPETLHCKIYEVRPEICRKFFCNTYLKKKNNIPDYRLKKPVNMLLTFSPGAYCPNPPDLKEYEKKFKALKQKVYGGK